MIFQRPVLKTTENFYKKQYQTPEKYNRKALEIKRKRRMVFLLYISVLYGECLHTVC